MKLRKIVLALLLGTGTLATFAQNPNEDTTGAHLGLKAGVAIQNFQNLKSAKHILNGTGKTFGLEWGKEMPRSIWNINVGMSNVDMESSLSQYVQVKSTTFKIDAEYLRQLDSEYFKWYLGVGLNSNFNLLENSRLQNDQSTYNFLNTLMVRTAVRKNFKILGREIQGEFAAGLGLLALSKDTKSFAFTAPQEFLEKGKFNYQGATGEADNPFRYHQFMGIGKYRRLQTKLNFRINPQSGKRHYWTVGYLWDYYSYEDVKNYRVTSGTHNICLSYNFMFHRKK
jgi:hypothetical protein